MKSRVLCGVLGSLVFASPLAHAQVASSSSSSSSSTTGTRPSSSSSGATTVVRNGQTSFSGGASATGRGSSSATASGPGGSVSYGSVPQSAPNVVGTCAAGAGPLVESGAGVNVICGTANAFGGAGTSSPSETRTFSVSAPTDFCFEAETSAFFATVSVELTGPNGTITSLAAGSTKTGGTLSPGTYTVSAAASTQQGFASYAYELTATACN